MKLVIATPSPFARKARIALLDKKLAHEVVVQNPWQSRIARARRSWRPGLRRRM